MDFLKSIVKNVGNEYASIAEDGISAGDITGFIDTGAYSLNALLSGSIYGGMPSNKITAYAGEPSTGKTFLAIATIKQFLDADPEARVACFLTESDISKQVLIDRGIDVSRIAIFPVSTVEEFRTQLMQVAVAYQKLPEKERPPFFCLLDSLGMLSTTKEMADIESGSDKRDMTRAQLTKGAFRALTLKLGQCNIPLLMTNHIYDVVGCAVAGTLIKQKQGFSLIEYIKTGDKVMTFLGEKEVGEVFVYETTELYDIEFDSGHKETLTGDHKLMVQTGEWKKVSELNDGDIVVSV